MRCARLLAGLALTSSVVFAGTTAAAHSSLVSSTPEDGAALAEPPTEVVLEFDSELLPDFSQVAVIDADENHYEDGEPATVGESVTQAVTDLPAGQFRISYRVGSSDGHPVTGVVAFSVEAPEGDVPADEPDASPDRNAPSAPAGEPNDGTVGDAAGDGGDGGPAGAIAAAAAVAVVVLGAAGVVVMRRHGNGPTQGGS